MTQPNWAVIDPATGGVRSDMDGVDVTISVERGQKQFLARRIALDPPASPEQRVWHRVVLDLPRGSDRLIVEVHMRGSLNYDRVWVTEAVVSPQFNRVLDRVALILVIVLSGLTLMSIRRAPLMAQVTRFISSTPSEQS